ncbi:MAG: MgtC/SapB family protein [Bacteroidia bacterium]
MIELEAQLWILLDVAIAGLLSGLVGLEREFSRKPAGLRTQMIIGAAAALFVLLGTVAINQYFEGVPDNVNITPDPIRIFEAIVVGVSFIGAGTIMQSRRDGRVTYLTTAASLLISAGIGMSIGFHLYYLGAGLAVFAFFINYVMGQVEKKVLETKGKGNRESG